VRIPVHLKHKPVIALENYEKIDGNYPPNETDAKGLSIGLAQWNEQDVLDISAKIWRHSGEKWSRQSEEMPLHRVLDLAILICHTMQYFSGKDINDKTSSNIIANLNLQANSMPVEICEANGSIKKHLKLLKDRLKGCEGILAERMKTLATILKKQGY
jgi:hypothetical protein